MSNPLSNHYVVRQHDPPLNVSILSPLNPPVLRPPPPPFNPPPPGGTVTWPKKHRKYQAPKAPKKMFYRVLKLIYTVILWYSFVVRFQPPPPPRGGRVTS